MEVKEGYKQTEVGIIPEDWTISPLEDFTSFISYGFTNPMPTSDSGICMVTARDINHGKIQYDTARCTTKKAYQSLLTGKSRPKKDDLLLTKDGTLGRLALTDERTVCINQSVAILRPNSKTAPQFFKTLLESPYYQNQMKEDAGGSTIKHIYITIVNKMLLAFPPTKAEQEAIAEALSDADALIESLEQLIAKKRQIKQGAMQELLTGKKRLPGFEVKPGYKQTEVGLIPEDWEVKPFQQICILKNERVNPKLTVGGHNCIELEHISQGTGKILGSTTTTKNSSIKNVFCKNDVLFGKLRAYLRKHVITEINGVCSTEVWVLKSKASTTPKYLYQTVKTERFIDCCSSSYGTHMPRSDWNIVKELKIPLPTTKAEQDAIAMILTDMDSELDSLRSKLSKARQVKQGMMHNLLTGKIRLV